MGVESENKAKSDISGNTALDSAGFALTAQVSGATESEKAEQRLHEDSAVASPSTVAADTNAGGISSTGADGGFVAMANQQLAADRESANVSSAAQLFRESFSFESNRSLRGAAQIVGLEHLLPTVAEPEQAHDWLGEHAQMGGRAIAGLLPTLGMAAASRFGMGKLLGHEAATTENILLKRSAIGLSATESSVTGLLVGSLLTPTEGADAKTSMQILADRMQSGAITAMSYGIMTASSFGWNKLAGTETAARIHAGGAMRNVVVNGIVSGIPAGVANVELDSLVHQHQLSFDDQQIGKSVYEMSLFGGVFGLGTHVAGRVQSFKFDLSEPKPIFSSKPMVSTFTDKAATVFLDGPKTLFSDLSYDPMRRTAIRQMKEWFPRDKWLIDDMRGAERKSGNFKLSEVVQFIAQDPERLTHEVENAFAKTPEGQFTVERLQSREKLRQSIGPDSDAMFNLSKSAWSLSHDFDGLNKFIQESPETRAKLVRNAVPLHATEYELSPDRFAALERLNGVFGDDSPAMKRLVWLDGQKAQRAAEFGQSASADAALLSNVEKFIAENPTGKALIEKMVSQGATSIELDPQRLGALEKLKSVFGENSPALKKLLENESKNHPDSLHEVSAFIAEDPAKRGPNAARLLENVPDDRELSIYRFQAFDELSAHFAPDSPTIKRLIELDGGAGATSLMRFAEYVEKDPATRVPQLEKLVAENTSDREMRPSRLQELETLNKYLRPETVDQLKTMEGDRSPVNLGYLSDYVSRDPINRSKQIQEVVENGGTSTSLSVDRLRGLEALNQRFPSEPNVMKRMLEMEAEGRLSLSNVWSALELNPGHATDVMRMLSKLDPSSIGAQVNIQQLATLHKAFADEPKTFKAIVDRGLDTSSIVEYLDKEGPEFASGKNLITTLIQNGVDDSYLRGWNYSQLESLFEKTPMSPPLKQRLLNLLTEPPADYGEFDAQHARELVQNPRANGRSQAEDLLDAGASANQFSAWKSSAIFELADTLKVVPNALEKIVALDKKGVDVCVLCRGLTAEMTDIAPAVKELLNDGTEKGLKSQDGSPETPNDFVNLVQTIRNQFHDDAFTGKTLANLIDNRATAEDAKELKDFINANPSGRKALIEKAIDENASLVPSSLPSLEELSRVFGADSKALEMFVHLPSSGIPLEPIIDFVKADPTANKALIEKLIGSQPSSWELAGNRLTALKEIHSSFGEESDTTKGLLQFELIWRETFSQSLVSIPGYMHSGSMHSEPSFLGDQSRPQTPLPELAEFIKGDTERAKLVTKVLEDGGTINDLKPKRLESLQRLNRLFGENSVQVKQLVQTDRERGGWLLSEVADYIDGSLSGVRPETVEARKALVAKAIEESKTSQELFLNVSADRLIAMHDLRETLADRPESLRRAVELDKQNPTAVGIFNLLARDDQGVAFIEKFLNSKIQSPEQVNALPQLYALDRLLQPDTAMTDRILELHHQGVDINKMIEYVELNPERNKETLSRLISEGADAGELNLSRLILVSELEKSLGIESNAFKKIMENENTVDLAALSKFAKNPTTKAILIDDMKKDFDPKRFQSDRLNALLTIDEHYKEQPNHQEMIEKFLDLEHKGVDLSHLGRFFAGNSETPNPYQMVESMISLGLPANQFQFPVLKLRQELAVSLNTQPELLSKILSLTANSNSGEDIMRYILNPHFDRAIRTKSVVNIADVGVDLNVLNNNNINDISNLLQTPVVRGDLVKRIVDLSRKGLDLSDLAAFIGQNSAENVRLLSRLLDTGWNPRQLSVPRMRDALDLFKLEDKGKLSQSEMGYLRNLNEQGLSGSRLWNFIAEHEEQRLATVSKMIAEGADLPRFKAQMDLGVFPDTVASKLADSAAHGGMPVARILSTLRDLNSGRYFYQKIVERAQSGEDLSGSSLEKLSQEAKTSLPGDYQYSKKTRAEDTSYMTAIARESVAGVEAKIAPDKNIVVLGRDMVNVLPLLRTKRTNVQYFLYSRLHLSEDGSTARQWLKEVPPGSAVIDSGFGGSIIDKIKGFDPTVSGFLLSSGSREYKTLISSDSHHQMVVEIEQIAKRIGRSTRYTEAGNAVSRPSTREMNDASKNKEGQDGKDRWQFERESRERFRAMGLSDWDAWRYTLYTGLTPKERLTLSSDNEVELHYTRVAHMRAELQRAAEAEKASKLAAEAARSDAAQSETVNLEAAPDEQSRTASGPATAAWAHTTPIMPAPLEPHQIQPVLHPGLEPAASELPLLPVGLPEFVSNPAAVPAVPQGASAQH